MHNKRSIWSSLKKGWLILTALALFACGGATDQQLVQKAREYITQAKVREASIELKNALQKNPENAQARYLLGKIYLEMGDMATAEKEFKRAAEAGWPEEQIQIGLARAKLDRKALQELLNEVIVKDSYAVSTRANLYALRALAQAGLNNQEEAARLLSKATQLDSNALYVWKAAIIMQLASGDIAGANKNLKQALVSYNKSQEILLLNALAAISNKDLATAAASYRKVVSLEPHNLVTAYGRKARLGLTRLEILAGNLDQAQATLAPLFKQNANDPETNFVGGLLAFKQGKLELAEKRLFLVLKVQPGHTQTQLLFGAISYTQGHYEQAAYYLAKYINTEPENLGARKLQGRTYIKLGQHEKAQAALQPALRDNRGDAELLALVGLTQLQAGDMVSGIKGLEAAVKAEPENLTLKSQLAKAYISTGETENAIRALNTMLAKGGSKKQAQVLLIAAHMKAEQYSQAIDVVLGMLREYLDDPAVLTLAGNVFMLSNDPSEARNYLNRAIQLEQGYLPATVLLARLEEFEGNADTAVLLYKKLAQTNEKDINSLMALARLADMQNRPGDMVGWLQQASIQSPQDIASRKALIEYYLLENQLDKADSVLIEAINIAPDDNSLLELEARLQIAEGQYNEALATLDKLVGKAPDSVYMRTLLSEVYLKLGQQTNARRQLGVVLEKQEDYVPALVLIANMELQSGNIDKVMGYAARVQQARPDLYMGYELAGNALMYKADYAAAISNFAQAWQRKKLAQLAIKFSIALVRGGKASDAIRPLHEWLNVHPEDVEVLQFLGASYENMRQINNAIKAYKKVLSIQPDNVAVLNNLAWLYSLSNSPEALDLAERAYKAKPEDSSIQDTYGWVLVQRGQVDKGRRILERLIRVKPEVPEVQYHYAIALLKSGEEARAREMLGNLLENSKSFEGRKEAESLLQ